MLQNQSFKAVFWFMFFGMFMSTVLVGGVLALIAHLVGGPLWLVITLWSTPPVLGLIVFLKGKKSLTNFFRN